MQCLATSPMPVEKTKVVYFGQFEVKNLELRIEDWGLWIVDCEGWQLRCSEVHEVHTQTHTDTQTHGHMDRSTYLKMDLKIDFLTFFKLYVFGKLKACALRICNCF